MQTKLKNRSDQTPIIKSHAAADNDADCDSEASIMLTQMLMFGSWAPLKELPADVNSADVKTGVKAGVNVNVNAVFTLFRRDIISRKA
eukprot:277076-Rhodomonas_salina.3